MPISAPLDMARLAAPAEAPKTWCSSASLCFELAEAPSAAHSVARPSHYDAPFCHTKLGSFPAGMASSNHTASRVPVASKQPQRKPASQQSSTSSPAQTLQLESITAPKDLRDAVLPPCQPALERRNMVVRVGSMLQPQGETQCDRTWVERAINIVTSLPFSFVGLHMLRQRQSPEGRRHAGTLVAVGACAALYHASSGSFRSLARKADYWTIAYSASEMIKALYPGSTWARRAASASLLAVPFRPFVVSSVHAAVMEMEFIRQARANKELRRDLMLHVSTAALGTAAFFLEDPLKEVGFEHMHGIWHCLACYGCATMNSLLAHNERRHLGKAGGGGGGRKRLALQLQTHCSASSLLDLQRYSSGHEKLSGAK